MLSQCREREWIKERGKQRTDSTHVLAAIRTTNRLECVGETMRHALNILAEVAPGWLLEHMKLELAKYYQSRFSDFRLPKDEKSRMELLEEIGADGRYLARESVCSHKLCMTPRFTSYRNSKMYLGPTVSCK